MVNEKFVMRKNFFLKNDEAGWGTKGDANCVYYEFKHGESSKCEACYPPVALRIIEDKPVS